MKARVSRLQLVFPWALGAVGLLSVFHPMILSGLRLMHAGLGDARLINYVLEHGFLWLTQHPGHENFWNPPIFYPYPNVSAFTDILLGTGPLYWIWRFLAGRPDTGFQLWLLSIWAMNYAAAYFMLRRTYEVGRVPSAFGAYVLAFGNVLQARFGQPQLIPLFYVLLAFTALAEVLTREERVDPRRRVLWIAVFFACVVLQAYTAIYVFFYFGFLLGIALLAALGNEDYRARILELARRHRAALCVAAAAAGLMLAYLAGHYLETAHHVGVRAFQRRRFSRQTPS